MYATGALKVLVYEHVSSDSIHGAPSRGLSARDFAAADIVLTTYETLQKDVNRQGNIRTYSFRQAKKYEASLKRNFFLSTGLHRLWMSVGHCRKGGSFLWMTKHQTRWGVIVHMCLTGAANTTDKATLVPYMSR